jgi:hypothetical protein
MAASSSTSDCREDRGSVVSPVLLIRGNGSFADKRSGLSNCSREEPPASQLVTHGE